MAIKIFSDRIEIGNFTLRESNTGLQFNGVVEAEYYNNADTSFTGSKDGYNMGGYNGQSTDGQIYKFNFANFNGVNLVGSLGIARAAAVGMHSSVAGYAGHGLNIGTNTHYPSVEKFTFSSSVNSVAAFQVWTGTYGQFHSRGAGCSSAEYGFMCGGGPSWPGGQATGFVIARVIYAYDGQSTTNTIASTIAARLLQTKFRLGGCSSPTHGYVVGGDFGPLNQTLNVIERFPFAYELNGADVGDLGTAKYSLGGISSNTHGYVVGGLSTPSTTVTTVEKFPFAAAATNSTNVAFLARAVHSMTTLSSKTEGFIYGGVESSGQISSFVQKFPTTSDNNATESNLGGLSLGAGVQD